MTFRPILAALPAVLAAGLGFAAAAHATVVVDDPNAPAPAQTKNGTIIWNQPGTTDYRAPSPGDTTPRDATQRAPAGPDKNGIIWDDKPPKAADRSASSKPAAQAPVGSATPDKNGIIWNDGTAKPGANSAARPGAAPTPPTSLVPPSPPRTASAAPAAPIPPSTGEGPCREFQTTIVIDGRREPAHGTACQQPDGTWRVVNR